MTAIQLRAELFREMNPMLENEAMLTKMLAFVRSLFAMLTQFVDVLPMDGQQLQAALGQQVRDFEDFSVLPRNSITENTVMGDRFNSIAHY